MFALLCSLLAASASLAEAPAHPADMPASKQRPVLGGAGAIDVSDARVQAAAAFAAASVEGTLDEVTSATRQVVAGTIYRITFTTTDGRSYSAEIFHSLQGEFSVRSIDETGDTGSNMAEDDE